MRLLLHICCAPCSVMCIETLRAEGIEPTGFWYNPNIHPVTEYKARKNTLTKYAADIHLRLIVKNEYGLRNFFIMCIRIMKAAVVIAICAGKRL